MVQRPLCPYLAHAALHALVVLFEEDSHPIGRYNLGSEGIRSQAKLADCIGIFPESIEGCYILILPTMELCFDVPYGYRLPLEV